MKFVFDYRDPNLFIMETLPKAYQLRFYHLILGVENLLNQNIQSGYGSTVLPPPHFGYDTNPELGENYQNDRYLLFYPLTYQYYPSISPNQPSKWFYLNQDFIKLEYDNSIRKIYTNGGFKLLNVEAKKNFSS